MIYFDNSATTPVAKEVVESIYEHMNTVFANPSSRHTLGIEAEKKLAEARNAVAKALSAQDSEIIFTSGGTEGDNISILGGANIKKGNRIVTSQVEHPAVARCMDYLEGQGFEIIRIKPNGEGNIEIEDIKNAINDKTSLVSIMHVNNETGAIMPIDKIKAIMKEKAPRALLHVDAVQSFGHIPFLPSKWGVDMASISGHKIHASKGVGALYIRKGVTLKQTIFGGGQEMKIRSGTENTSSIWGLKKAVELIDLSDGERILEIKNKMKEKLLNIENCVHNGGEIESPFILNISFGGIRSEIMLNALSSEGIYVSSGSACSSTRPQPSAVLTAMGAKMVDNAIRFSFSRYNTMDEAEFAIDKIYKIVKMLR